MELAKSIEQIEGDVWPHSDFDSYVVRESQRLRKVPISELSPENLRLLIGQKIALHITVPLAIDKLEKDFTSGGHYFPGDLLLEVAKLDDEFWSTNPELNNRLVEVKIEVQSLFETLRTALERLKPRDYR